MPKISTLLAIVHSFCLPTSYASQIKEQLGSSICFMWPASIHAALDKTWQLPCSICNWCGEEHDAGMAIRQRLKYTASIALYALLASLLRHILPVLRHC